MMDHSHKQWSQINFFCQLFCHRKKKKQPIHQLHQLPVKEGLTVLTQASGWVWGTGTVGQIWADYEAIGCHSHFTGARDLLNITLLLTQACGSLVEAPGKLIMI